MTKTAVLTERIRQLTDLNRLQKFVFAVGGLLAGAGLSEMIAQKGLANSGGILALVGISLMLVGQLSGRKET